MEIYEILYLSQGRRKYLTLEADTDRAALEKAYVKTLPLGKLVTVGKRYKFGGGWEWALLEIGGQVRRSPGAMPATIDHRGLGTSPGMPKWYKRLNHEDGKTREFTRTEVTFKPGAKPVLPKYAKRIEDIEGYEP